MAYNLARNSRVFVTTNLSTASGQTILNTSGTGTSVKSGQVRSTGFTTANTFEVQILDGFSFNQATQQQTIQINEASATPIRGQRSFNTSLDPVAISFSTYARPRLSGTVNAEERILWNALLGDVGISGTTYNNTLGSAVTVAPTSMAASGTIVSATVSGNRVSFIGGTAFTSTLAVGEYYTVSGMKTADDTYIDQWNASLQIVSKATTTLVVDYLNAVSQTGGTQVAANSPAMNSIKFHKSAWVEQTASGSTLGPTVSYSVLTPANSNKNQLQPVAFIFIVDNATYIIEDCVIDSAALDFGLDSIASIAWTAQGTRVFQLPSSITLGPEIDTDVGVTFTGGISGTPIVTRRNTTAGYITNKLSTVTLTSGIGGSGTTSYSVVMTGGTLNIQNNIQYITPQNLGTLNTPVTYVTGARNISGNITAYLKTGTSTGTGALLDRVIDEALLSAETKYRLVVQVGGVNSGTRIEYDVKGCSLTVPTIEIGDLISTNIAFTAQGTNGLETASAAYNIEVPNEIAIRYYAR